MTRVPSAIHYAKEFQNHTLNLIKGELTGLNCTLNFVVNTSVRARFKTPS